MTGFKEPLEIRELPDPSPGPADAVVRVGACGVCRSDWHFWQGEWTWLGVELQLPLVLGHELGGTVESVGNNVTAFKTGDRVTLPFHMACGRCEYCNSGRTNICKAHGVIGKDFNGGFGELANVPAADVNLVHLPDEMDFVSAAAAGCRFMTAYHGVVDRAQVRPAEWICVFGLGGIGLSVVQIASMRGAQAIAVDIDNEKLKLAEAEGAVATINAAEVDAVEAVKEITGGGSHVSVDALGGAVTTQPAVKSLRKGGRHLQLGMSDASDEGIVGMPMDMITVNEITIVGSVGCPTTSYPGLLTSIVNETLDPKRLVSQTIPVEKASDVLLSMSDFNTVGFNVITEW